MRSVHAFLLCLGMTIVVPSWAQDASSDSDVVKKDRQAIAGKWSIVRLVIDGKDSKPDDLRQMFVVNEANGNWSLTSEEKVVAKGTSTIDPTKTPKTIDFITVGGDQDGDKFLGIYELGKLGRKMCFAPAGEDRPTDFAAKSGTDHISVEFKRFPEPQRLQLLKKN